MKKQKGLKSYFVILKNKKEYAFEKFDAYSMQFAMINARVLMITKYNFDWEIKKIVNFNKILKLKNEDTMT